MQYSDKVNTEILATMGPTLSEVEQIVDAIQIGVRNFRIHMGVRSRNRYQYFVNAREAERITGEHIEVLIDLPSAKPRVGKFNTMRPIVGENYCIKAVNDTTDASTIPLKCIDRYSQMLKQGHRIVFSDGKIVFQILSVSNDAVNAKCIKSCSDLYSQISSCVFPDSDIEFDLFDQDDLEILQKMKEAGLKPDWIAISFANSSEKVNLTKDTVSAFWDSDVRYMAKIEDKKGVSNYADVLSSVDGIMVARGDMLSFVEPYKLPYIQKVLVDATKRAHKTSVVATEMLEQFAHTGAICRPELSDIALAVRQKANAVMLSVESSNCERAMECMRLMHQIVEFEKGNENER